jgi:heme/copper-type cytochrome/quinol oxidase subunit 2
MRDIRHLLAVMALTLLASAIGAPLPARGQTAIEVTIKDHQFTPAEIHVPAGKPAVLHITNQDPLAEEFDSSALKVEKVIAGGRDGTVRLRPLDKGSYPFTGEYHADTAKGVVIAE